LVLVPGRHVAIYNYQLSGGARARWRASSFKFKLVS
jgi:hypothetical protein